MTTISIRADVPSTVRQHREFQSSSRSSNAVLNARRGNLQTSRFLIVSPYIEPAHQLDLASIDTASRLLAQALTKLEPVTPEYATAEYSVTFNWATIFETIQSLAATEAFQFPRTEFYVVDGKSQLKEQYDNDFLFELDKDAHAEATTSGGLLKYWYGSPDREGRNLATCVWRNQKDALVGGAGMWHKRAQTNVKLFYQYFGIQGLKLIVEEGAKDWRFEPWLFH